jgi:hypothetical protein
MGTIFKTKEVSMKWLKRLIWQWNQEGQEIVEYGDSKPIRSKLTIRGNDIDADDGLNITVRKAIGGRIVTFRHYDPKTDRHNHRLYVIPEELDFERELGKMITLESMRG